MRAENDLDAVKMEIQCQSILTKDLSTYRENEILILAGEIVLHVLCSTDCTHLFFV